MELQPALLCHLVNHSLRVCLPLTIGTIHFVVCTSRALERGSRWEEVELSRLLKQDEKLLQGSSPCCRSASHSTDMVGIELAVVLGDSKALIDDTPLRRQLVRAGHCCSNRYADSATRILPRDTAEEFATKGGCQRRVHRGGGC